MGDIICYQYYQCGKCIWLRTLYERPQYAMDCVVKWRVKRFDLFQELRKMTNEINEQRLKEFPPDISINYWAERLDNQENEQWRYM